MTHTRTPTMLDHTLADRLDAAYLALIRLDHGALTRDQAEQVIREQGLLASTEALLIGASHAIEKICDSDPKPVDRRAESV